MAGRWQDVLHVVARNVLQIGAVITTKSIVSVVEWFNRKNTFLRSAHTAGKVINVLHVVEQRRLPIDAMTTANSTVLNVEQPHQRNVSMGVERDNVLSAQDVLTTAERTIVWNARGVHMENDDILACPAMVKGYANTSWFDNSVLSAMVLVSVNIK